MKYLLMLALLILGGKAYSQSQSEIKNDTLYKSVDLDKDDATFLKLKALAQSKIAEFVNAVKVHGTDYKNYHLMVKSDFVEGDEHEHMWTQVYAYRNGSFDGVFVDKPFAIKKIKTGQRLTIKQADIEDWVIYDANDVKIAGGFSLEYLGSKEKDL
ncbi:DUF2314 domain-containing protein [Mucilaginibacter conchicola]|uniref:DUF2314 domain-containing protein n=1 Tax=Mucilaginibacter conchicola TaxID=2303333 RepID=A0A372NYW4_9SPHI|nr:DUF2314 domain-containing protein [Mucilaginibacter conchicola]RFZ95300.1 DUF2314 domain-containing protein [Mucilaginibacter conchicola]